MEKDKSNTQIFVDFNLDSGSIHIKVTNIEIGLKLINLHFPAMVEFKIVLCVIVQPYTEECRKSIARL